MTLNELIDKIPYDHRDAKIIVRSRNKQDYEIEYEFIEHYGMDSARIVLRRTK